MRGVDQSETGESETMQDSDLTEAEPRTYDLSEEALHPRPRTVLMLEDDEGFALALKETLEQQDYRVTIVPSGTQGIEQVLARDFDVILCDMVMPNFPGDMFYLAVQRARPHLCDRFVFMTGYQSDPKVSEFLKGVGHRVLWKPFAMRDLFEVLETLTSRSR